MHADKCIAKVTNFVNTLEIYQDLSWSPSSNRYVVTTREINDHTFKPVERRHPDLLPQEAVFLFNKKASGYGFNVRVSVLMPRELVARVF
jgi:hypothetical protein